MKNMKECIHCHSKKTDFEFSVIEIQTLHIRDIGGERYVQGMGEQKVYGICESCGEKYLYGISHPTEKLIKRIIPFGLLIAFGIAVFFFLGNSDQIFSRLLGPVAVLCGILGIIMSIRDVFTARREYQKLREKDRIWKAAWDLFLYDAPKKNGDQDITYIPVNETTGKMDVKELSSQYDLLPPIASKVWKKMKEENDCGTQ